MYHASQDDAQQSKGAGHCCIQGQLTSHACKSKLQLYPELLMLTMMVVHVL